MEPPDTSNSQRPPLWWLFPLAVLIALNWCAVLRWGLTIDETGTFAIVEAGFREALHRAWIWTGQSVLYNAIASFFCFPISHGRDFLLRLPSIFGVVGAAVQLFRFAEEQNGKGSGWPTTLIFCSLPPIWTYALFARPYGLLLFVCVLSNRMLWRWLDTHNTKFLIWSWLSLLACVYLQILTVVMAVLQVALVVTMWLAGHHIDWKKYLPAGLVFCVLLTPLYFQNHSLEIKVADWQFTAPSVRTLWEGIPLKWCTVALAIVLGGAGLLRGRQMFRRAPLGRDALWLPYLLVWWLAPAALFFLLHEWRGMELMHSRYLLFTSPALALVAGAAAMRLTTPVRLTALAVLLAVILFPGRLFEAEAPADFAAARDLVNSLSGSEPPPLLAPTWYVEGRRSDIDQAVESMPFLFSYLDAYPLPNPVYRMPRMLEDTYSRDRFDQLLDGELRTRHRFLIGPAWAIEPWVYNDLQVRAWRVEIHHVNSIQILECIHP